MSRQSEIRDAGRRRAAGYVALAVLVGLVGIAWLSGRPAGPASPAAPAAEAAPAPSMPIPSTVEAPQKGLTETLPPIAPRGAEIVARLDDVTLSPQARLMAERFVCVCGCKDILATCTCNETPGSRDMKQYVQQLVAEGKTPAEVEAAMVARYGEKVLP
jgi:cytochrome c-type biogenesis protein CcmH/NrfF